MVDKGFLIEKECTKRRLKLIRPTFLSQRSQFSSKEANDTASIAAICVHVERSIQRLKIFKILKGKIPANQRKYIDSIMSVIVGFVNSRALILGPDKF